MAEVISIQKSVQHNNGDSWELENYPPFAQTDNAEEWLGVSEISLERAKELAFQLAGDEAYDYEDEIESAEDLYELQDVLDNFKYYQRDNTYNSSWWGGVVDFGVLTEDGEGYGTGLVLLRMHRGGDPRGNYYEMRAFELDSFIEEFPPYFGRLTYYIKTDEGDLTLDTEDMEGYSLMVVEDETGTFEQDEYVKIDEVEDAFDMNGNSFFSFGGGVAVGSLIGAYIGYKVGRTRGKQKGGSFATEKKIYGKVKKKFDGGGGVDSKDDVTECKKLVSAFCKEFGSRFGLNEKEILSKVKSNDYGYEGASVFIGLNVSSNIKDLKVGDVKPTSAYISLSSEINPNGVSKTIGVARTYTIDIEIKGQKRYTQRRTEEGRFFKSYNYGLSIEEVIDKTDDDVVYELFPLEKNYDLKLSMGSIFKGGGGVEDEIANIDNRIYNIQELKSRTSDSDDIAYYDIQIANMQKEKQELLNPSKAPSRKKLFGLFKGGGRIDGFTNDPIYTKGNISIQRIGGSAMWNVAISKKSVGRITNAYTKEQAFKKAENEKFEGGGGVDSDELPYPYQMQWEKLLRDFGTHYVMLMFPSGANGYYISRTKGNYSDDAIRQSLKSMNSSKLSQGGGIDDLIKG